VLPDFLHIGSAKAASTWLYEACLEHPEIYVPPRNDNVNFFLVHYDRGPDWYQAQYFADRTGETVGGEFSNSYLLSEIALERIARDLPEVRLTCLLRNPIDRAYLNWAHMYFKSGRPRQHPDTDSGDPIDILPDPPRGPLFRLPMEVVGHPNGWTWCRMWLEPGLYAAHLRRIQRLVPERRLHVMLYDDLCSDPETLLHGFFGFLGVDPAFRPDCLRTDINPDTAETDPANLTPELRGQLRAFYRQDIAELSDMLGRDLSSWE
jgi:hypothetical protein